MTKTHKIDYHGFVYLWRDKKRKISYIGSHLGSINDSYKGSSTRFKRAINKRPEDFRRKILAYVNSQNRKELLREEERWLQMIKPHHLQRRYYNVKRCGTGGYVTEGYNDEQRKIYIERLKKRSCGGKHYAARKCFCLNKTYDALADAIRDLGWNPIKRLASRKFINFYWIDQGEPTAQEIKENTLKTQINKHRSIEAMRKRNLELPNSYHKQRTIKALNARKTLYGSLAWKKPTALRKGRKVSIDGIVFNNLKQAEKMLLVKSWKIRQRARSNKFPTWFYVDTQ